MLNKNTIFLHVVLLGGIDSTIINNDQSVLGILNIEYDRLFSLLDKQNDHEFSLELDDVEYSRMRKERRYKGLIFDENGLIMNTIIFTKLDNDYYETVEISRTNIPSVIWSTDIYGNKKRKLWPIE